MEKLSFFDRVSLGALGVAAIAQALQQALKDAPAVRASFPVLNLAGGWSYVSLALLLLAGGVWLVGRSRWRFKFARMKSPPQNEERLGSSENDAARSDALLLGAARALTKAGPAKDVANSWFAVADLVDDLGRAHGFEPPRRNSPMVQINLMSRGILPPTLGQTISSLHQLRDDALTHPEGVTASHAKAYGEASKAAVRSLQKLFPPRSS